MRKVYLMRHGETLFNLLHKKQGWCDSPLTDLGIYQAKVAKKYFEDNNITFDYAFSSTSERASDTLELVTDMPYKRCKGLKEWFFGKYEAVDEHLNPPYPYNDFFKQFGGEGELEFRQRAFNAVKECVESTPDGSTILIVCHGGFLAQFYRLAIDLDVPYPKDKGISTNCAIWEYDYQDEKFSFIKNIFHDFSGYKK